MMKFTVPFLTGVLATTACLAEAPRVVATVKPIHSLVAMVMGEVGTPDLIVKGGASPHTYSLRPSDAAALEGADVVFWTGHGLELFLENAMESLAGNATVIELANATGVELLPIREGGAFDAHSHGDEHDHDDHAHDDDHEEEAHEHEHEDEHEHEHEGHDNAHEGEMDMHYWLDPANAVAMVAAIAGALSDADPANAETYSANAAKATDRLAALTAEIDADLAAVRERPFVVFHDAYQYFEQRFGLTVAGSITVTPDIMPGAQRISELKAKINDVDAACVFAEPQFEPAIVATIIEGTAARSGTLDPEGSNLDEGPDLYPQLVGNLSAALVDCLAD